MGIKVRLRQPRPLLRAAVELVHALNAFRPLGRKGYVTFLGFWFGWRTTEVPHLFMTASMIDAVRPSPHSKPARPRCGNRRVRLPTRRPAARAILTEEVSPLKPPRKVSLSGGSQAQYGPVAGPRWYP